MATEEPQLGSIQERIAALRQSQAAHPTPSEPPSYPRPPTERSRSANNPPSYHVTGSVLDNSPIGNQPADERTTRPVPRPPPTPSPIPEVKPKPKVPPPLPTKRERAPPPPPPSRGELPPSYAESRPNLPPRRPTDQQRRPSVESVTSDASHSTATTTATSIRGASTTSVNSTGTPNGRIKAPAWGETELPALPPKRPKEDLTEVRPSARSESKSSSSTLGNLSGGLSAKFNSIRGKSPAPSSSSSSSRPSVPSRPSLPSRPSASPAPGLPSRPQTNGNTPPVPQLPPRRPSGVESQSNVNQAEEPKPSLPVRRLPPTPSAQDLNNIRQTGFGGLNKAPPVPGRPNSTPADNTAPNGTPPPIPHSSRPDLSKIQATKPRFNGSAQPVASAGTSNTCCLVCRDFSGPDQRAAQYPRETLPSHDIGWLANELTAPFPSATDKARVIFKWLHHNIIYDTYSFFNNCVKPSTPASTIASGLAVCEGFAGLFAALATKAGLEAVVISGHGKGYGHEELAPGAAIPPFKAGHAWNAVRIDGGEWKLIDSCWGGGHLCEASGGKYKQEFHPRQFTMSNDEFGLKHFPSDKAYFFRDDGRPEISWEEYMRTNPDNPLGGSPIKFYSDADKNDIGRSTVQPANGRLSVYSMASPVRFQFGLLCQHWTLAHHSRMEPALFFLIIKGIDGRKDERLPFHYIAGSGPGGGGACWYVDVPDARMLGAPGQKVLLCVLTSFGDRKDCRGVTRDEYLAKEGRVGMSWSYIAEWELVR